MKPALRCTYCHDALTRDEAAFCAGCLAPQHTVCRQEHGRCAAPGCAERAVVRPRRPRRAPPARGAGDRPGPRALTSDGGLVVVATLSALAAGSGLLVGLNAGGERAAPPPPRSAPVVIPAGPPPRHDWVELQAAGLTIAVELLEGERLALLPAADEVNALRLRPDGTTEALLVAPARRGIGVRLPEADDASWTHIADPTPTVFDVDGAQPHQPRLRRRAARPDELQRLRAAPGTLSRGRE